MSDNMQELVQTTRQSYGKQQLYEKMSLQTQRVVQENFIKEVP